MAKSRLLTVKVYEMDLFHRSIHMGKKRLLDFFAQCIKHKIKEK